MQLVYGFVSKHESLVQMIEKRAKEVITRSCDAYEQYNDIRSQLNSDQRT